MAFDPDSLTPDHLNDLRAAAEQAWGDDTRAPSYVGHPQPSAGQCYVTSAWLQDRLGGHIGNQSGHYFWVSPERSHVVDLTGDQFAYKPNDPAVEGHLQDDEDEPWAYDADQTRWRPGPVMFKRADHPLYRGFRVVNREDVEPTPDQRTAAFARRANAAMSGQRFADLLGADPYPGETPEKVEQMDQLINHDEPTYSPESEEREYSFVLANGEMHLSANHSHDALLNHAGAQPDADAPSAVGYAQVHNGHVLWKVESNIGRVGLRDALEHYSNQVGWRFDGVVSTDGQPMGFGPVQSYWYREDGERVVISKTPLRIGKRIAVRDSVAYAPEAHPGLEDWAKDAGLKLAEVPGGGNMLDHMRHREDMEMFNRGDPEWKPEEVSVDAEPKGPFSCPKCDFKPQTFGQFKLHMDEHQPHEDEIEDGHFPQIDDFDEPLPLRRLQPKPTAIPVWGSLQVMVLPNRHELGRIASADVYGNFFGWNRKDPRLRFYGAYSNGELVGYGVVCEHEPDSAVLMIQSAAKGRGVGPAILDRMKRHYSSLYSNAATDQGARLMMRHGMIEVRKGHYRWAQGKDPKDLLEAEVPFVYDIQHDRLQLGYPGSSTHDVRAPGGFTPGGIVEGYYEPGGKVTVQTASSWPWSVRHLIDLWYWTAPQMEVTSVEQIEADGKNTKLASLPEGYEIRPADEGWFQYDSGQWIPRYHQDQDTLQTRHGQGDGQVAYHNGEPVASVTWQETPEQMLLGSAYTHPDHREQGLFNALSEPLRASGKPVDAFVWENPWLRAKVRDWQRKTAAEQGQAVGPYLQTLVQSEPAALNAYKALKQAGGQVYVVGGAVRDALLNRVPQDIDLMVGGLPSSEIAHVLRQLPGSVNETGKRFGVFRYKTGGQEVEIALPRSDTYETGRRGEGQIQVDPHLPVESDLQRRDFTANSMAVDLDSGKLIDPYGGARDIDRGALRTTHPDSFQEDPTRLIRALTAHGRFGLSPDEKTRQELSDNAHLLQGESPDALNKTLDKLFKSENPAGAIRLGQQTGVLQHVFPEVAQNWDYDQRNPHHRYPLGDHLMQVLDNTTRLTTDPDVRMAALYHDAGKPASAWQDPQTGNLHYYRNPQTGEGANHEDVGAQMVEDRLSALNYPRARINRVRDLVQNHMFAPFTTSKGARRFLQRVGDHADDLLNLREADQTGKGQTPEEVAARTSADQMRGLVEQARSQQAPTDLSALNVNGNDLLAMGMQPGPAVGQVLRYLTDEVVENPMLNNREQLLQLAQQYVNAQPPESLA